MSRKLKRPSGEVMEEYTTASSHFFHNGKYTHSYHGSEDGQYSGRFWFRYNSGKMTRPYTKKTAPKWLLNLYLEATNEL